MDKLSHLAKIVLAIKGNGTMDSLTAAINAAAGESIISTPTLYGYTSRPRRPEPKQIGLLAKHMARNPHERAEILRAYIEDTLDATDIAPSERGLDILIAVAESKIDMLSEHNGEYNVDRPDRDRDLDRLRDAWHTDADLRELLFNLSNLTVKLGDSEPKKNQTKPGYRLPRADDTLRSRKTGA